MSNQKIIFTVFTPTYNRAHLLGRAFQNLKDQTFLGCAPRAEPPGVIKVEAGEVLWKGVRGEDQRDRTWPRKWFRFRGTGT